MFSLFFGGEGEGGGGVESLVETARILLQSHIAWDSQKASRFCETPHPSIKHESHGILQSSTWTPKVGKIMAFMAIVMGLGLLFYILLGFRYNPAIPQTPSLSFPNCT